MCTFERFRQLATPPRLKYTDFSGAIYPRVCLSDDPDDIAIFNRICTPYIPDAFQEDLDTFGLTDDYSLLVGNLRNGFPIGDMPLLEETVIIPNHSSCAEHSAVIDTYILAEVEAGRMSGPFTRDRVEAILGGPFFASPLIVAVQTQEPGVPDKLRVCRNLSKGTKFAESVNSHIAKDSFPTRFDTAMRVADIVSLLLEHLVLERVGHRVPFYRGHLVPRSLST